MNLYSSLQTEHGSRYLQTLCKHFGRKIPVRFDTNSGTVELPFGRCDLKAGSTRLDLTVCAESQGDLNRVAQLITSHLDRYAFRENPDLQWSSSEPQEQEA